MLAHPSALLLLSISLATYHPLCLAACLPLLTPPLLCSHTPSMYQLLLLQLPGSLLHGCSIHMPAEPPAAHHTAPTPNRSQKDAAADPQQQQGKAHAPAQVIGHVALDGSDAASE
jgi:hypothetical protein